MEMKTVFSLKLTKIKNSYWVGKIVEKQVLLYVAGEIINMFRGQFPTVDQSLFAIFKYSCHLA